ncbi:putative secreted protein [Corynebacterium kutscheri]|uniref:Secreted protein n=1 Tax=Corynebacterium kutscheri TaxID=35755 RepID=A0A0F6R1C7_9CORY|nr:hypothetical protein [Corynebacterium kutscheri]AKE40933.1 hypothetical protein UL82_03630 [Corynebacterium kutscheri]VEH06755.1 putative secreted protein [Corynebacterium kutscheri]VEH09232.1 putative secreted protein [Corynebacterium kutscheri]VEH79318.1 putative secreted protein [Corynebacterium kutscheri]
MNTTRYITIGSAFVTVALALSACGGSDAHDQALESITVAPTTSANAGFEAQEVAPIIATSLRERTVDTGLNVEYELQTTAYNSQGSGSVVYVLIHNLNDVALPVEALGTPKLKVNGNEVSGVEAGTVSLDLPLAPHASTNLAYAFSTNYSNLWNAEFTIGNVTFQGNLSSI